MTQLTSQTLQKVGKVTAENVILHTTAQKTCRGAVDVTCRDVVVSARHGYKKMNALRTKPRCTALCPRD